MPLTKEERIELLAKAREKKRQLAEEKKKQNVPEPSKNEPEPKIKKKKEKKEPRRTLDISLLEDVKKPEEEDLEIKNEVIRIKAPKKKTIIKRVIEVEEPSSDEEIQEEIIKIPKKKSTLLEQKQKETEGDKEREKEREKERKNSRLFYDIFPN